jgi:cathepsin E
MVPATLLTTLLLAMAVAANPVLVQRSLVTLPISKRVNITSAKQLLQHDQARAQALKAKGQAKVTGISLQGDAVISSQANNEAVSYIAAIGVGSPATTYQLIVDTGSSNTWVGATQAYVKTSTSVQTSNSVAVTYGSGSFSGTEFTDQVTIASGLVIPKQSIGVASTSTGFTGVDGIIGIGPVDLTDDTLSPATTTLIPTVTDNLFSAGTIPAHEIAVSFEPITGTSGVELNGELTWGGTDSTKFTGSITFTPLTTTSPASEFWGINQSILYGTTTIQSTTAGIVDTGTTLVLISTNAFKQYEKLTGGVNDANTGLLKVTSAQFAKLETLSFDISGVSFGLTANAQIWPRSLNSLIGGASGDIFLIVNSIGTPSGEGLDFINGQTFLERFYAVFDTTNKRVGLATTSFTSATTN